MYRPISSGRSPAAPKKSVINISEFRGADLTSNEAAVNTGRSPRCPNMIRSSPGKVRKRVGYHRFAQFNGRINGYRFLDRNAIVHAGTKVYFRYNDGDPWQIFPGSRAEAMNAFQTGIPVSDTGVADSLSSMICLGGTATIVFDGKAARRALSVTNSITGATIHCLEKLTDYPYVPTVMISRDPVGGGVAYEEVNILSDGWTETFYGTADADEYQMSFSGLSSTKVQVSIMTDDQGTWTKKTEGTDFTVDREAGIITFVTPPGVPPIDGTDNIKITAYKDRSELANRINKCTICASYGDSGTGVRLFCTGNPDYPNRDFWSALNDPTYFPDLNYSRLGRADSAIVGYSVLGDKLAAHKDEVEGSIYVRSTTFDEDGYQQFYISNVIKGRGAIAPRSFAYLTQEPLFLTRQGIYAITTADLTQERYEQSRSFYLNGKLLEEANLESAYAAIYKDFYVLAVNDKLYILDGSTKAYERNEPYSNYQYEAFYFTNINARIIWTHNDECYFGTDGGDVFVFYKNSKAISSYNDDGAPISACWQTAALDGANFYKNKFFRRCAIRLAPYAVTGVFAKVRKRGIWELMFDRSTSERYFDFGSIDFGNFTFRTDAATRTWTGKIRVGKTDSAVFCFENNAVNAAFGPDSIAFEFIENGNFKGI